MPVLHIGSSTLPTWTRKRKKFEGDRRAREVDYGEASRLLSELLEFGLREQDPQYVSFQHLLEEIHDPWIDQFFEWVTRWSAQGYGLFLG